MSFANPAGLLWALPAVGAIVALYMLRLRRRDVTVPSIMLWRRVVRDAKANTPFQRLRRSLLLAVQVAAALLLAAVVARPFVWGRATVTRAQVIVIDASASMGAREGRGTRLDAARREAEQVIDRLGPGDRAMLIAAGARPVPLTGFTSDRHALRRALGDVDGRDTGADMRQALVLAGAMLAAHRGARIHVVTDGGFEPLEDIDVGAAGVTFHQVGTARENVGITAVDHRHVESRRVVQVLVALGNFGDVPRRVTVTLSHGPDPLDAREVDLAAGAEVSEVLEVPSPIRSIVVKATVDREDALAADNRAYVVLEPHRPIDVLLVTRGNPHLQAAIEAEPAVRLSVGAPGKVSDFRRYDVAVFDGEAPVTAPTVSALYIDCAPTGGPVTPGGTAADTGVLASATQHPLLRYVDLGRVRWRAVSTGTPAPWAQPLASVGNDAAIIAGERGSLRSAWTGFRFDTADGAFPYAVSYPVLVTNAVRWLARAEDGEGAPGRTGTPIQVAGADGAGTLTVTAPDGARRQIRRGADGTAVLADTDRVGVYRVGSGQAGERLYAANLVSAIESSIAPRATPPIAGAPPSAAAQTARAARHAWPWLAAGALALLCVEWWLFHRRVHLA